MSKRVKLAENGIETREEMESLVGEIAALAIERDAMTAEMEGRIQSIRAEYEARLVENQAMTKDKMLIAADWAMRHPEAFGKNKSVEMVHAVVGFRTGTPMLKTLSGWTWAKVKTWLEQNRNGYTRSDVVVNKELILADRKLLGEAGLRQMGVKVAQDESFFVEPKREQPET